MSARCSFLTVGILAVALFSRHSAWCDFLIFMTENAFAVGAARGTAYVEGNGHLPGPISGGTSIHHPQPDLRVCTIPLMASSKQRAPTKRQCVRACRSSRHRVRCAGSRSEIDGPFIVMCLLASHGVSAMFSPARAGVASPRTPASRRALPAPAIEQAGLAKERRLRGPGEESFFRNGPVRWSWPLRTARSSCRPSAGRMIDFCSSLRARRRNALLRKA